MQHLELLFGLFAAVAVIATLANRVRVPEPVLFVAAGLAISFVPALPEVELDPDLTLAVFLPPLLYWAALHISVRQVRENVRPISFLAVGFVLATMVVVAVVGHLAFGLPWAVAAVLGAIVAPPDPLAAVSVGQRLGVPRRIVTILEGEGLLNDATALVAYRVAVGAAVTGAFSPAQAAFQLVVSAVGGTLIGLAVGWGARVVLRRVAEVPVENTVNLLVPFAAWLLAERFHASGVLSVLACGVWMSLRGLESISSAARLQARQVWDMLVFILEGLAFLLIGLQLPAVVRGLGDRSPAGLAADAVLLSLVVIAVRLVLVFPSAWLPRRLSARIRARDPYPGWRQTLVIGWAGMRGMVSLALALAIPATVGGGGPLPGRDLVVFLTFSVIVVTLVGQGLTLPALVARLGVREPAERTAEEESDLRTRLSEVALARLDELEEGAGVPPDQLGQLRARYHARLARHADERDGGSDRVDAYRRLVGELLHAQRDELRRLRDEEGADPAVTARLLRDLDAEQTRLDRSGGRR